MLEPHLAIGAYSGAFTSFANTNSTQWVDANSPSVQYYGVKYGWTNLGGAALNIRVYVKYTVECRATR